MRCSRRSRRASAATGPSTSRRCRSGRRGSTAPSTLAAFATTWWIEYGRTRATASGRGRSGRGSVDLRVGTRLTGLSPGVRWHYRVVARSAAGTSVGADASFATPPRPLDPSGRPVRCTIVGTPGGRRDSRHARPRRDLRSGRQRHDSRWQGRRRDLRRPRGRHPRRRPRQGHPPRRAGNDTLRRRDGRRDVVEGGRGVGPRDRRPQARPPRLDRAPPLHAVG